MLDLLFSYPITYPIAIILAVVLAAEIATRPNIAWRIPALVVIGTIFAWYLIEPIYTPETFAEFDPADVSTAFMAVIMFLLSFRLLLPFIAGGVEWRDTHVSQGVSPEIARKLLIANGVLWVTLAAFGIIRMDGDVVGALFPNGRAATGMMWGRGAVASGAGDTLIAALGYIYLMSIAVFGMLLVFVRGAGLRAICVCLVLISWPYAFMSGARNTALAAFAPGFLAFLLYGRAPAPLKLFIALASFVVIDQIFLVVITYRNLGFDHIGELDVESTKHAGLNMASELTYIVNFLRTGVLFPQWGYGYIVDFSQFIPRALWPDKPMLGADYAIARGFGSVDSASGMSVTISLGVIGEGVRQFGPIFGPIAPAAIMALWVRILTRLRVDHRDSRVFLYLLGLGLTFNLGRDITLLILWPFVFAYAGVFLFEFAFKRKLSGAAISQRPAWRHDPLP